MLHDLGSRDTVFINIVAYIREKLVELAGRIYLISRIKYYLKFFLDASPDEYTVVLLQGSGTYAVEATFSTSVPRQDAKVIDILFNLTILTMFFFEGFTH
jgi:2-aminoethylphosphonate-pyruvate transaminase